MDAAAPAVKIAISAAQTLLADRRYFIPVVTDVLIKHQEQSAAPVSFSFKQNSVLQGHTHLDSDVYTHMQNAYNMETHVLMQKYLSFLKCDHTNTRQHLS